MSRFYNLDEVLAMAIRIEQNGRAFYLRMAEMYPEHNEFLTHLADEEIAHKATFTAFRDKHAAEENVEMFDPDGLASMYLSSVADSLIFKTLDEVEDLYVGQQRIEEIIEDAISREQDSVTFFTGIKSVLKDEKQIEGLDAIIAEEMTHIAWLMGKRQELELEGIDDAINTVFDLIVVGAGPGGVSLAAEAIEAGMDIHKILLLEQAPRNSWIIRKLYPEQKLVTANYKGIDPVCHGVMKMRTMTKNDALQLLNATIIDYNMHVLHEMKVHTVEKKGDIFEIAAGDKIFKSKMCGIGIGVFGKPNKPDYKIPAPVRKLVQYDITSIRIADCDVLVVGGGDSSAEYVRVLVDEGNNVTLASREDDLCYMNDDNRAMSIEWAEAGKFKLLKPINVTSVEGADGRILVNFDDGTDPITVDRIVYALGGTTPMNFLQLAGVEVVDNAPVMNEWFETNVDGLFLLGDLAAKKNGGALVNAFNVSHTIMSRVKEQSTELFS